MCFPSTNTSGELNKHIIQELHRSGVDLCNEAMKSLLTRRERRANEDSLNEEQKKQCRPSAIGLMDLNVANLNDAVREIDGKVTSFQKEVDKELKERVMEEDAEKMDNGDVRPLKVQRKKKAKKRRTTAEKEWDSHHPHASRKRKVSSSSGQQSRQHQPGLKQRKKQGDSGRRTANNATSNNSSRRNATDAGKRKSSSTTNSGKRKSAPPTESTLDTEEQQSSGEVESAAATTNFEPDIEFIGDTDDIDDDHHGSVLPAGVSNGAGRSSVSRRGAAQQRPARSNSVPSSQASSRGGGGSSYSQQSRPISENMGHWLKRQEDSDTPRPRASNAQSNISRRQGGVSSVARSKNNAAAAATARTAGIASPAIPRALSADMLFDSLSLRGNNVSAEEEHPMTHPAADGRLLSELCQEMKECYPSRMQSCQNVLHALTASILSKSLEGDGITKDEVVTVLQALLHVLQRKCTTLLDILQTNPEVASLQMDCWCLVFRMFEKKLLHGKIVQDDGILYQIFGKHSTTFLAKHMLLQVIDVLYSQLLWEEYGQTATFDNQVFDQLRSLCRRIESIVPLFPTVCDLLSLKFGKLSWHKSLTIEQKENELENMLFVSAIDPEMHMKFIQSGDLPEPTQGVCVCLLFDDFSL